MLQAPAETAVDPQLKEFARIKRLQAEELAATLHLDTPPGMRRFFEAAEAGDCAGVSNAYVRIQRFGRVPESSMLIPSITNLLIVPIQETRGAYVFCDWEPSLLRRYAGSILGSIPDGSVYFGGTDPGRFVVTMYRDTTDSPDIVVLTPKFVITQNELVDTRCVEYLRLTVRNRLWLPSTEEMTRAFQMYSQQLRERQARGEQLGSDIYVDSAGNIHGVAGVMNMNATIAKMIFDHNKDKHPFYVEESYVIGWMYPYMTPHGLILKLNNEPLDKLGPAVIERDREFWAKLSKELLGDPKFIANEAARKTYSKMRSAIGGLYAYRKLTDESEAAYKQAITLCPASPEANFRLAQLYLEGDRRDAAVAVLEQLLKLDPGNDKIASAIRQIRMIVPQPEKKESQ